MRICLVKSRRNWVKLLAYFRQLLNILEIFWCKIYPLIIVQSDLPMKNIEFNMWSVRTVSINRATTKVYSRCRSNTVSRFLSLWIYGRSLFHTHERRTYTWNQLPTICYHHKSKVQRRIAKIHWKTGTKKITHKCKSNGRCNRFGQ